MTEQGDRMITLTKTFILGLFSLLLMTGLTNFARAGDVFAVEGVPVDVTAESAAKARGQALLAGEQQAFDMLLKRLTMDFDHERLPKLDANYISAMVRDFEVAEEKTSNVRYIATLNYRFKDEEVRQLLKDYDLPFAETASKPVLVVPVFIEAGASLLWDEPNYWRQAWDSITASTGLVPMVLPLGDLADIATLGVDQALEGDIDRLTALAKRYGASDALVAQVTYGINAVTGAAEAEVFVTRYAETSQEQSIILNLVAEHGEERDALLQRAAQQVMIQVENHWKRDNLLQFGNPGILSVTIPVGGLKDWVDVKKRLSSVAVITKVDLVLMSRNEIQVNLNYIGELEQLTLALTQVDLGLFGEEGNWTVTKSQKVTN
ncbi:MAG: DUF2066 domain-containing protein [Alphaproteobacteria bacterium]|nr:DUF2066 domain-containing protein [Rhodospirillales bacterium]MCW9046293.1 DUF2066 domain-containing protein [Alphaproteobacteria bacterium]